MSDAKKLINIVQQVLGFNVDYIPKIDHLLTIPAPEITTDQFASIRYYIQHQELITVDFIHALVEKQLQTVHTWRELSFNLPNMREDMLSFAERWQAYIDKLESALAQVEFRSNQNYELNMVMPPQKQILELQHECMLLTEEWYGPRHGNLSSFYSYFIRMCELARITRFKYLEISKEVSSDEFVSLISIPERKLATEKYQQEIYFPFLLQGGQWTYGRSDIDSTSIANIFYAKHARQLIYLQVAKHLIMDILKIKNYGKLEIKQKELLWKLILENFPAEQEEDQNNIFYKFANFVNRNPGAYFTDIPSELLTGHNISAHKLHTIIQIAGLSSGNLILISRRITENWSPKRYMVASWQRQYPLANLRVAGIPEQMRIWPNEMPYCPMHGLSLCTNGLVEGLQHYNTLAYEWNVPIDHLADINNSARDIEKMFRELKILCPNLRLNTLLPQERLLNVYQNTVAYSTQATQHIHITSDAVDEYNIYCLSTKPQFIAKLQADVDLVVLAANKDAMFVKITFASLDNEQVIRFLLDLHAYVFNFFGGPEYVDVFLALLPTKDARYVFIYEPHAYLEQLESGEFYNAENHTTHRRKPQWVKPQGDRISLFNADNELAAGKDFIRDFYCNTAKKGVYDCIQNFIDRWLKHQNQ